MPTVFRIHHDQPPDPVVADMTDWDKFMAGAGHGVHDAMDFWRRTFLIPGASQEFDQRQKLAAALLADPAGGLGAEFAREFVPSPYTLGLFGYDANHQAPDQNRMGLFAWGEGGPPVDRNMLNYRGAAQQPTRTMEDTTIPVPQPFTRIPNQFRGRLAPDLIEEKSGADPYQVRPGWYSL